MRSALALGYYSCHTCSLVVPRGDSLAHPHCPRCHTPLHGRKGNSLSRTWALVITAVILYIPANLYPVMTVTQLGRGEPKTIMGGVIALIGAGMWPLAAIVFIASVLVPVMKLVVLTYLLVTVQNGSRDRARDRTYLYRIMETFGHWSMVDVFLVSILAALVNLGALASIEPGIGVSFFGTVVVTTMFAARAFDPRLIWDVLEEKEHG